MKKLLGIILAIAVLFTFAACTGQVNEGTEAEVETESDLAYITEKGTLLVGITDYAPMDYKDENGEWTGFDAEFALAVAAELGLAVEFVEIDWDNKFLELESKAIDCIWNGMTITDEVKGNTSCSDAYAKNEQIVVMKADAVANFADIESMAELTFAAESGSAGEAAGNDAGFAVTAVTTQTDALMEVAAGSTDACIIDSTMAEAMTGEGTGYADLAPGLSLTKEEYGIGFRKGSDLTDKVNEIIAKYKADGTLAALSEKYTVAIAD